MSEVTSILSAEEKSALQEIAARDTTDGKRAAALLAIDGGMSRLDAAAASGLTAGQVDYLLRRFREERLALFRPAEAPDETVAETVEDVIEAESVTLVEPVAEADAVVETMPAAEMPVGEDPTTELRALVLELNELVGQLQKLVPDVRTVAGTNPYSPVGLLVLLRDNAQKLTPDVQSGMLQSFQGMTPEDLLDIDTWKGMAYMMTYSARFQAGQVKDKVSGTINGVVPEPIQPGRLWSLSKSSLDRITPEFAKQIMSVFDGATPRDLLDPDTWKGLWYMINYSIQFQAEQLKNRLTGTTETTS